MATGVQVALSINHKRAIAVLALLGGIGGARQLRRWVKAAQLQQKLLCHEPSGRPRGKAVPRIAVDGVFWRRLRKILALCVPGVFSWEAALVGIQGVLLVSRTLLTDYISRVEGFCGRTLVSLEFGKFSQAVLYFALVGIPAAVVNSGLKFMQKNIELSFQQRLTLHLHQLYTSNRAYYAASTLGGLTHADQRITEDCERFAAAISDLYSHTFKPLLDVVLFTHSLSRVMGYRSQLVLYAYYFGVAHLLRALAPPLATMAAQEAGLSGSFRAAHQRLVAHAEEVAFNDPPAGAAERLVLNQHLARLIKYARLSSLQRFLQQISDGYFVKYFASCVALTAYALPLYFTPPHLRGNQGQLTADYIRSMRLLQNTSRGIGDLILVYKRVAALAGHTGRVAELLEQVDQLAADDAEHKQLFARNASSQGLATLAAGQGGSDASSSSKAAGGAGNAAAVRGGVSSPHRLEGETISFSGVALDAPDGAPLVRDLTFEVHPGCSVMLMGPNGCGKSSLFRVLAGLWPLQAGSITAPPRSQLFYLSQRPYLVSGSLRDQLLYPRPPAAVWAASAPKDQAAYAQVAGEMPQMVGLEEDLLRCLRAVELEYLLGRGSHGWDTVLGWSEVLSGGEKQRLAMARLLFHRPKYAILDECTSAVSADGEVKLYEACTSAGITLLSIAHRPSLKRFHQLVVHVDGTVSTTGRGWWTEELGALTPGGPRGPGEEHDTARQMAAINAWGAQRPG